LGLLAGGIADGCARPQRGATPLERDARGRNVLRFWNGFTGPDGKTMERMVAQFRRENPDIDVRMQIIPWGTYYDKLTLALAYGGAPELFIMHADRLPEFASFGALRDLTDLYAAAQPGFGAGMFAPNPWAATFFKGGQYALPLDVHPIGLYYNTDLFKRAGIVDSRGEALPPANWDEFLAAAKALTVDHDGDGVPEQWGYVFTWQRTNYLTFLMQFGGALLTPDNRAAMSSPAGIAAIERMHSLVETHRVAPRPEGIDAWLEFRQGKVAMAMEGIYMLSSLEEQKGLAYAGAPVPQFGTQPGAWCGSHLLAMPAHGSDAAAQVAWRLIRFLSDHSIEWAKGGQVPARNDVRGSDAFRALPVQSAFARQLPYVHYESLTPKTNALFPFVDPAIEAVLLDLQNPREAMTDADRRINQVMERP